jgi:hypothetical protein
VGLLVLIHLPMMKEQGVVGQVALELVVGLHRDML